MGAVMRKRIVGQVSFVGEVRDRSWLDLDSIAQVELSSEDAYHTIEAPLAPDGTGSWRASESGEQFIRLIFDQPTDIGSIILEFSEATLTRTQEFVLAYTAQGDSDSKEIVRQQFCFSPPDTTRQKEEYSVELGGVTMLELRIVPDISGGPVCASLKQLRLSA